MSGPMEATAAVVLPSCSMTETRRGCIAEVNGTMPAATRACSGVAPFLMAMSYRACFWATREAAPCDPGTERGAGVEPNDPVGPRVARRRFPRGPETGHEGSGGVR